MWGRLELFREEEKRLGFVGKTVVSFSLLREVADDERWLGLSSSISAAGADENLLSFFATAGSSISLILLLPTPPGIRCLAAPFTFTAFSFTRFSFTSLLNGRSSKSSSGTPGPFLGERFTTLQCQGEREESQKISFMIVASAMWGGRI